MSPRDASFNLPNALTVLRIFLVPLLVVVLLTRFEGHVYLGSAIFGLAVLTDYLDGYFARRRNEVTRLGILLDPLADKLLVSTALIVLLVSPYPRVPGFEGLEIARIPAWATWMVVVIVGRELAVTGLRSIASAGGRVMAATWLGKVKALCQNVAIGALLFPADTLGVAHQVGMSLLFVATALTLASGYLYFRDYFGGVGPSEGQGT